MIKLIKNTFYKEEYTKKQLSNFIKNTKYLSFNTECIKFEKKFSHWQKRKHCVLMNSGSSANLAIIQSLINLNYLKKEDNVGFSALTWSTNVMPLLQLGLNPIPIDIEINTLNISSKKLLYVLKRYKIKLLFLTNLLGFCDDIDKIKNLCNKNKIILIEDNCEAFGSIYKKNLLGNFGLSSTFSFYVGHHISTIEGGAVCTDDDQLAEMLRIVRAHGWDRNLTKEGQRKIRDNYKVNSTFYSRYTFYDLGYNLRPTEITGFIGLIQLKFAKEIIFKRNKNFIKLAKEIYNNSNYYKINWEHMDFISNFAVPIVCKSKKIKDNLVKKSDKKVEIRPIVGGNISEQPFFKKYSSIKNDFSYIENARIVHENGLYFGNNPDLTSNEIRLILKIFS